MSNLSDLLPAGASAKSIEAVATATIASKAPVILNSAGTVTEVAVTNTSNSPSIPTGTETTSNTDTPETMRLVFDPFDNTRFLFVYKTDAGVPRSIIKLRVGTISGTTITLNTVTTVYGTSTSSKPSVAFDPDNENVFVVTYQNESSLGYAKVGTISGSRGSESVAYGAATQLTTFALGGDNTLTSVNVQFVHGLAKTFILSFTNTSTSYPYAVVFTYSGTTITSGTETVLNSAAVDQQDENIAVNTETAGNFVASYVKADSYLYCKSGNISGTTITMDSNETKIYASFANSTVGGINWCNGTSDKFLWSSKGGTSSQRSIFGVGTLTGTTFTATTTIGEAGTGNTTHMSTSTSISDAGVGGSQGGHEFIATYKESNDNYLRGVPVNVVGTTVTVGTSVVMVSANHGYGGVTPFGGMSDSVEGTFAIVYRLQSDLTTGYIRLGDAGGDTSSSNLTAANFVGIADAGIATSATGTVVVQGGTVTGMSSLTTGAKYYVQDDGSLTSPDAPIAYTIAGASYDSVSFSVSGQTGDVTGMCFNADGTKMYVTDETTDAIYQYSLSSAYDLSTASYDSVSLSVVSQQGAVRSVVFNNDGTSLYITGTGPESGYQYDLTTPYDLSTASYASKTVSFSSQELYPCGLIFNADGTSMYIVGSGTDTVYQYTLSPAFDLSTASYASKSMSVNSEQTSPTGLAFNSDGTKIFISGESPAKIFQYSLSSAYDISTGSYDSVSYTYTPGSLPRDIVFNSTGLKFYIPDSGTDAVYQYTVGGGATSSVNAGLAISTTSLLLNGDS